jgi:glycosyltransferase involved in cell wall biosynthesis
MILPRKNQNTLMRALDILISRHKFRLIFLGAGSESDPYFREFLQLLRTRPWCIHEGFVSPERLQEFLSRATALILASLEDNCPMVVLEAVAAGVPVIAAKVGGIPSLIQDGHTGLLFDPEDLNSITSAVERYLSDSNFTQTMAKNARVHAETAFRPSVISKRHVDVYHQVLDQV